MREFTEGAGLRDNELNSGQLGLLEDLGRLECSWKQVRQIPFPFGAVRTTAPSRSVLRSGRDSIRPDRSHSRCCTYGGRAARLENCDRALGSRERPGARLCANVQRSGDENESDGMSVPIVSTHDHTRHVQGDATTGQGMTSSEVPHRRQFWQSIQFLVSEKALHGFRRNWHIKKNRHLIWECGVELNVVQGRKIQFNKYACSENTHS